jgi:hypothetical protein
MIGDEKMANPIEPAEILKGKEAEKFVKEMEYPKFSKNKERIVEIAKQLYEKYPF